MKKQPTFLAVLSLLAVIVFATYSCADKTKDKEIKEDKVLAESRDLNLSGAYVNHQDSVPSKQQYDGPFFELSHDYPTAVKPVTNPSWQQALKGQPISESNTFAYMDALKKHIAPNIIPFFKDNKNWTSAKYGWFNEPWLGSTRDPILGVYQANGNSKGLFKSLTEDEMGYALVLYDSVAAYTVGQLWDQSGKLVDFTTNPDAGQFKEGSIIVKFAFSNINAKGWPVMQGAETFSIYHDIPTAENPKKGNQMRTVSFFQMDVIVKDSKTAPQTGWVYSTFVYDKDAKGTFWDKMVPLGAMWGDDPTVNSPVKRPYPKLKETVINPKAPFYSTETLGWGGRLSGPNDGAVAEYAVDITTGEKYSKLPLSSCMSCHSPAQYKFKSFLLPCLPPSSDTLQVYTPGSKEWNRWFRSDYGNVPFDSGEIALDYDMVMAFKSIKAYSAAQKGNAKKSSERTVLSAEDNISEKNMEAFEKYRSRTERK